MKKSVPQQTLVLLLTFVLLLPAATLAQDWFGLPLPEGLSDPFEPTIMIGEDSLPQPVSTGAGIVRHEALRGSAIRRVLTTIVEFSRESYRSGDRMWGRIAGYPSFHEVIAWSADELGRAGIEQVSVDLIESDQPIWVPLDWSVKMHGPGPDIELQSAFPQRESPSLTEPIRAPLVFVGTGAAAELAGRDIAGKIAVVHKKPDPGLYHSRTNLEDLLSRRPAAIMVVVELPGNMQAFDSCIRNVSQDDRVPCFYLGGQDGQFLEAALHAAARQGATEPEMSITLTTEDRVTTASNAVAILPGRSKPDEYIIVNAHADGYFEAASDNGDGLAVFIALARHFAQAQNRTERSLVFVASAGHHTINGARAFVEQHPDIIDQTVFILNLEHIAQMNMQTSVARPQADRAGYRDWVADRVEFPQAVGITPPTPFLANVFRDAALLTGKNINSVFDDFAPGELGGYRGVDAPMAQLIYASPIYHTSGDVLATITEEGLERAALFFEYVISEVDIGLESGN